MTTSAPNGFSTHARFALVAACLAVHAATGASALAQEPTTRPRQDIQGAAPGFKESTKLNAQLSFDASFRFRGDLKDRPGEVSIFRGGGALTLTAPVLERNRLSVTMGTEQSYYDFSGSTVFMPGGGRPWRHIQSYTVGANFSTQWSEKFSTFLLGSVDFSGEKSAAFSNGFTGGGGGGFIVKLTETFDLGAGVVVRSRLGGGVTVFPIVGIDWRITPQWRLSNENQPGLYLSYTPNERWRFSLGARYDRREFRLEDDNFVPDGIGRDEQVPVTFGVDYSPEPTITFQLRVGAMVYQNLQVRDQNRNKLVDTGVDPALFISGGLVLRF